MFKSSFEQFREALSTMGIGSCAGDLLQTRFDDQGPSLFGLADATG